MHVLDTVFETSELENTFRRYINDHADVEIGGYFFGHYGPPNGLSYRQWGKATGGKNGVVCINDWLLVLNKSQTPENEFTWVNLDYLKDVVRLTSKSGNKGDWFSFHSHPKGSMAYPSTKDLTFAMNHCETFQNYYQFAIVQSYPLRVLIFDMHRKGKQGNKENIEIESGYFWSWRENALKAVTSGHGARMR